MIFKLKQTSVWLLISLWLIIVFLAAFAVWRPLPLNAQVLPPAPTLIWDDHQTSSIRFIKGLTKNDTTVMVTINNMVLSGLKQRRGLKGVTSFSVPLPGNLTAGIYKVTATAKMGGLTSESSQVLELVVPGTTLIQGLFVYKG